MGFNEIRIKIPPKALPNGSTGYIEIGICVRVYYITSRKYYKFKKNYQPIFSILWLCLQEENIHLKKPITVTLPRILPDLSKEEPTSCGVRVAEANHDYDMDTSMEKRLSTI